jgi:hypothetical protein
MKGEGIRNPSLMYHQKINLKKLRRRSCGVEVSKMEGWTRGAGEVGECEMVLSASCLLFH